MAEPQGKHVRQDADAPRPVDAPQQAHTPKHAADPLPDPDRPQRKAPAERRKGGRLSLLIPVIALVIGFVLLCTPVVTDWIEAWNAGQAISTVSANVDELETERRFEILAHARGYNAMLASPSPYDPTSGGFSPAAPEPIDSDLAWAYADQLVSGNQAMMAWIEIPKIAVKEPIYHGVDDASLSAGVGHVERTSLPVGGISSNCVLSAHSGVPTARMFDDLGKLEPGDTFTIWTLGEPYSYRVTGSIVVLPTETHFFGIEPGKDMVTLVTCTPYGVNSHRLLVFGERCAYEPVEEAPLAAFINGRTVPLIIAMAAIIATIVVLAVFTRRRRKRAQK